MQVDKYSDVKLLTGANVLKDLETQASYQVKLMTRQDKARIASGWACIRCKLSKQIRCQQNNSKKKSEGY